MKGPTMEPNIESLPDSVPDSERANLESAYATIERAHPRPGQAAQMYVAYDAALDVATGHTDALALVTAWKIAADAADLAHARMRGALALEVARTNESAVAQRYGVSRPTVRKAVGK